MSFRIQTVRSTTVPISRINKSETKKTLGQHIKSFPDNMNFLGKLQVSENKLNVPVPRLIDIGRFMQEHGLDKVAEHLSIKTNNSGQAIVSYQPDKGFAHIEPIELILNDSQTTHRPIMEAQSINLVSLLGKLRLPNNVKEADVLDFAKKFTSNLGSLVKVAVGEHQLYTSPYNQALAIASLQKTKINNGQVRINN